MYERYPALHRDIETRSCADLKKAGAHTYAQHPSTRILVAVWIIEYEHGKLSDPIVWHGDMDHYAASPPMPAIITDLIRSGCRVTGHNAAFESAIDTWHADPMLGWTIPKLEQLDCTMARAAVQALPLDLDRLGKALRLPILKDAAGHKLMLTMCKPRRPHKGEDPSKTWWHYDASKLARLTEYCIADVRSEIAADHYLRPLQEQERPVWLLDQIMNNRGVEIDTVFVRAARELISRAAVKADERMRQITGGVVGKITQNARLRQFARDNGVQFKTVRKKRRSGETYDAELADKEALLDLLDERIGQSDPGGDDGEIDEALALAPGLPNAQWREGDPPSVRAAFEIRLEAARSSLRKLDKFLSQAPHGRARGNLQYHAAGPGRWGGRGIQMQNLVRAGVSEPGGWDQAWRDMRAFGDDLFETVWGSAFGIVSRMMRGALIASGGHKLYFADYSNVEARGCVWAAGQDDMVELFASGGLIYEEMGAGIFNLSVEEVLHLHKTKRDIVPRFVGKETVLGCGYGMGPVAFRRNAKKKGRVILPVEICRKGVYGWRERNPKVCSLWRKLESAAMGAIEQPGHIFKVEKFVAYRKAGKWLQCRLPSGRLLWYRSPSIEPTVEDMEARNAGETVPRGRWQIHYWGVNGYTKQWAKETTWGGKLLENCIQGMCRDFLAGAQLRLEAAGYPIVLSVHDEVIAEAPIEFGSVKEFIKIMSEAPAWAPEFPLHAEGGEAHRYVKT